MRSSRFLSRHGSLLAALGIVLILYGMALPPRPTAEEQAEMASRFRFTPLPIPHPDGYREWLARPVHPSMTRISAWVSAMGAAAALGAEASVVLSDGRRLVAQVDGGNGHAGKRAPQLHFGLGEVPADQPLQVHIRWRDRAGRMSSHRLSLLPGWHTVLLGEMPQT